MRPVSGKGTNSIQNTQHFFQGIQSLMNETYFLGVPRVGSLLSGLVVRGKETNFKKHSPNL